MEGGGVTQSETFPRNSKLASPDVNLSSLSQKPDPGRWEGGAVCLGRDALTVRGAGM